MATLPCLYPSKFEMTGLSHKFLLLSLSLMVHSSQQQSGKTFPWPPSDPFISSLHHTNQSDFPSRFQAQRLRQELAQAQEKIQDYEDLSTYSVLMDSATDFIMF